MELKEKIIKAQFLRSQIREVELKLNSYRNELDNLDKDIKAVLDDDCYKNLSEDEFQIMLTGLNDPTLINIEVVYALRDKQSVCEIQVSRGTTIEDGIKISGILNEFSEINLEASKVGIHGGLRKLSDTVIEGDRIEIYRPIE